MDKIFLERLTDVIDTESELTAETVLNDIEEWDSLSVVGFLSMAQALYGKGVNAADVKSAQTVADLYKLVQD